MGLARIPENSRWAVAIAAGLATVWTLGALLAPALESSVAPELGLLRLLYHPVCHQEPERCLALGGRALATCARCTGLYVGGTAGLFLAWLAGPIHRGLLRARWLLLAATPTILDVALGAAGLPGAPNGPRLALGLPLGLAAGLLLAEALRDLSAGPTFAATSPGRILVRDGSVAHRSGES